jgi:hypothetical protein
LRRPLCFSNAAAVKRAWSAGTSLGLRSRAAAVTASCRRFQSRTTASSVDPAPTQQLAHWLRPGRSGGCCRCRPRRGRRFRSLVAIAAQAALMASAIPVACKRCSKSATRLLRYRSIGGMKVSTSRLLIGVALYAPATVRRHRFCIVARPLATPLGLSAGSWKAEAPYVCQGAPYHLCVDLPGSVEAASPDGRCYSCEGKYLGLALMPDLLEVGSPPKLPVKPNA